MEKVLKWFPLLIALHSFKVLLKLPSFLFLSYPNINTFKEAFEVSINQCSIDSSECVAYGIL